MSQSNDESHGGHGHEEELRELTVTLEEDHIVALEELARQYSEELDQEWDLSAVLRVAVGNYLNTIGKMT